LGLPHQPLNLIDDHQIVVDHLLKLLLHKSQILFVLAVLVLDQQEVVSLNLKEELGQTDVIENVNQNITVFVPQ
jgi:hypothetical protein